MKKMMKRVTLGLLGMFSFLTLGFGLLGVSSNQALAQWGANGQYGAGNDGKAEVGVVGGGGDIDNQGGLITIIKGFINWVLGLLALIALVILLWGGFQMLTAAGDETKYKKGWTILKQAGIALGFIALSWMIVSLVFYVIGVAAGGGGGGQ